MKAINLLFILFTSISALSCAQNTSNSEAIRNVDAKEFQQLAEAGKGQVVDVRTPGEYQQGHIKGAVLIDFNSPDFQSKLESLDKNKPVYVYCRSGHRSGMAVKIMADKGFKTIYNLQHGVIEWNQGGLPLVKD